MGKYVFDFESWCIPKDEARIFTSGKEQVKWTYLGLGLTKKNRKRNLFLYFRYSVVFGQFVFVFTIWSLCANRNYKWINTRIRELRAADKSIEPSLDGVVQTKAKNIRLQNADTYFLLSACLGDSMCVYGSIITLITLRNDDVTDSSFTFIAIKLLSCSVYMLVCVDRTTSTLRIHIPHIGTCAHGHAATHFILIVRIWKSRRNEKTEWLLSAIHLSNIRLKIVDASEEFV